MAAHPYVLLQKEYERNLSVLQVKLERASEIDRLARKGLTPGALSQYGRVQAALGIPIPVQHSICVRESDADFSRSPAQGDRWDRVSVNVPRGHGPYASWYAAAIDAWQNLDHLSDNSAPWSMSYAMWKQEAFNGFGYRAHGVRSPYLVGGTNLQQIGRYAGDGNFVEEWDTQIGTAPVMLRMIELMPSLAFGPEIARVQGSPGPALPVPIAVGGGLPARGALTGTHWLQDSLNRLMLPQSEHLAVDGIYGRFTRGAVRNFQVSVGIPADGLIGDQTCAMIDRELATLPH